MSSLTGLRPEEDVMLERCYTSPVTLRRLAEGAVGPFLDGFAQGLFADAGRSLEFGIWNLEVGNLKSEV